MIGRSGTVSLSPERVIFWPSAGGFGAVGLGIGDPSGGGADDEWWQGDAMRPAVLPAASSMSAQRAHALDACGEHLGWHIPVETRGLTLPRPTLPPRLPPHGASP